MHTFREAQKASLSEGGVIEDGGCVALQAEPETPKEAFGHRIISFAIPTPSVRFAAMLPASLIGFVCQPYGMAGIFSSGENHKTRLEEGALWGRAFLEVLKVKSITLRKAQTIFLINP